ncbi:MAG TPA: hypothetical protein PKJ10_07350 [Smithella sp.]|nr:hypothetical protein [Smithella sp.]
MKMIILYFFKKNIFDLTENIYKAHPTLSAGRRHHQNLNEYAQKTIDTKACAGFLLIADVSRNHQKSSGVIRRKAA